MRVEVGEGVVLLVREEGLPLGAGKKKSIVAGIAAMLWLIGRNIIRRTLPSVYFETVFLRG